MQGKVRLVHGVEALKGTTASLAAQGYRVTYRNDQHVMLVKSRNVLLQLTIMLLIGGSLIVLAAGALVAGAALFVSAIPFILFGLLCSSCARDDIIHLVLHPEPTPPTEHRWRVPQQTERGYYLA